MDPPFASKSSSPSFSETSTSRSVSSSLRPRERGQETRRSRGRDEFVHPLGLHESVLVGDGGSGYLQSQRRLQREREHSHRQRRSHSLESNERSAANDGNGKVVSRSKKKRDKKKARKRQRKQPEEEEAVGSKDTAISSVTKPPTARSQRGSGVLNEAELFEESGKEKIAKSRASEKSTIIRRVEYRKDNARDRAPLRRSDSRHVSEEHASTIGRRTDESKDVHFGERRQGSGAPRRKYVHASNQNELNEATARLLRAQLRGDEEAVGKRTDELEQLRRAAEVITEVQPQSGKRVPHSRGLKDAALKSRSFRRTTMERESADTRVSVITDPKLVRELAALQQSPKLRGLDVSDSTAASVGNRREMDGVRDFGDAEDCAKQRLTDELSVAAKVGGKFMRSADDYYLNTDEQFDAIDASTLMTATGGAQRGGRRKRKLSEAQMAQLREKESKRKRGRIIAAHKLQTEIFDSCKYCIDTDMQPTATPLPLDSSETSTGSVQVPGSGQRVAEGFELNANVIECGKYFYVALRNVSSEIGESELLASSQSSTGGRLTDERRRLRKKAHSLHTLVFSKFECVIVPLTHAPSLSHLYHNTIAAELTADECREFREELRSFQRMVASIYRFGNKEFTALFTECSKSMRKTGFRKWNHTALECIPMRTSDLGLLRSFVTKSLTESEFDSEYSLNKKVVELRGFVADKMPAEMPYVCMHFGVGGDGIAHVIEDEQKFDEQFARQMLAGVMPAMDTAAILQVYDSGPKIIAEFKQMRQRMAEKKVERKRRKMEKKLIGKEEEVDSAWLNEHI